MSLQRAAKPNHRPRPAHAPAHRAPGRELERRTAPARVASDRAPAMLALVLIGPFALIAAALFGAATARGKFVGRERAMPPVAAQPAPATSIASIQPSSLAPGGLPPPGAGPAVVARLEQASPEMVPLEPAPSASIADLPPPSSLAMLPPPERATVAAELEQPRPGAGREGHSAATAVSPAQPSDNTCAPVALAQSEPASLVAGLSDEEFGLRLADAAREQTSDFVVYNDRYFSISYPGGDVHPFFGACTDVVVRAFRRLGIDLQAAVRKTRLGTGDSSIDHRRTETLRRLFARYGQSLPISDRNEDYLPGDIVTYHRPENPANRSRSHIAIVARERAQSGRHLIIHNRGNGPELEDALHMDVITGHYRFRGLPQTTARAAANGSAAERQSRKRAVTR